LLNITVEKFDGQVILHCAGRLVTGHETRLLCTAIRQSSRELRVDLREITAVDAAGIGALVSLQAAGFYLTLLDPSPILREVLARTELDSVFEIHQTQSPDGQLLDSLLGSAA
jgi:anti-anti-sigma factor